MIGSARRGGVDVCVRMLVVLIMGIGTASAAQAPEPTLSAEMQAILAARPAVARPLAPLHATPCVAGVAAGYPCSNIDLLSFTPVASFAATGTNSLWGWTDAQSGIEYALVGADNGTAFFSLAVPDHPVYLGKLPTHTGSSVWRDVRVYANHAYIVSDNNGAHGMQVFNLTQLRGVTTPQTYTETAFVGGFGRGHTISINEATGFAYVAGSDACPAPTQNGGLRMYDIHVPAAPVFVGCISTGGYTHESQCWTYTGPDTAHAGRELCFNANGSSGMIAIVDVTNKAAPVTLSSTAYAGSKYTHQGWLTPDQRYLLVNDELDESTFGHNARTYVFDVSDIDAPTLVGFHQHPLSVIDHNLYVHDNFVYESDYEAGLRILRLGNLSQAQMSEVAFFDTWPSSDTAQFNGNWNNYRFPGSGNVIATGIDEGLFVLQPHLCTPPDAPDGLVATGTIDHRIDLIWNASRRVGTTWRVERAQGGCGGSFQSIADGLVTPVFADTTVSGQVNYGYRVVENDPTATCSSVASACVVAQTTGSCTAPPIFGGIATLTDAGSASCRVDLAWPTATPACGAGVSYSVYRGGSSGFAPGATNRIAQGLATTTYADTAVGGATPSYYVVRATDAASGAEESNSVEYTVRPTGPAVDGTFSSGAEPGDTPFDSGVVAPGGNTESGSVIRHAGWHTSMSRVHGGTQSFWSTAANNLCVSLVASNLHLTTGQIPQVSFWTAWDIEQGWDAGVVDVSTDNGSNWTRLTPAGGYPSTVTNGGTLCGITQGSAAFTGMGHFTWTPYQVNLAPYAGQTVQLRWLYRTDTASLGEGWFVDDVAISHAQVPGLCSNGVDLIFRNGFD